MTAMTARAQLYEEALREALARVEKYVGCLDGGCLFKPPTGQHTNAGCRCATRPGVAGAFATLYRAASALDRARALGDGARRGLTMAEADIEIAETFGQDPATGQPRAPTPAATTCETCGQTWCGLPYYDRRIPADFKLGQYLFAWGSAACRTARLAPVWERTR